MHIFLSGTCYKFEKYSCWDGEAEKLLLDRWVKDKGKERKHGICNHLEDVNSR